MLETTSLSDFVQVSIQLVMAKKMFMQAMGRAVVILWVLMIAAVGHVSGQIEATPPAVPTPPTVLSPPTGVTLPSADEFAPAPGPSLEDLFPPCQGVLVVYTTTFTKKIYPYLNDTPWIQPYRFQALATLLNQGYSTIANWEMGITYQHGEVRSQSAFHSISRPSHHRECYRS